MYTTVLISLRTTDDWVYQFKNKSKTNCDLCGAILWFNPGGKLYCDEVHDLEGLNDCDRCKELHESTELVWLSDLGFEPNEGEVVPEYALKRYDALCEKCYKQIINTVEAIPVH